MRSLACCAVASTPCLQAAADSGLAARHSGEPHAAGACYAQPHPAVLRLLHGLGATVVGALVQAGEASSQPVRDPQLALHAVGLRINRSRVQAAELVQRAALGSASLLAFAFAFALQVAEEHHACMCRVLVVSLGSSTWLGPVGVPCALVSTRP